jgi:L-lactate dehydrogenase complex protein LldE
MRVALFITCLADQFYPGVGEAAVKVLRRLGVEVSFNQAQTCCGQPAFNTGFRAEAREVAARTLDLFTAELFTAERAPGASGVDHPDYIVSPSGSCTSMMRVFYPELFEHDPLRSAQAQAMAARVFEFSEFLVKVLKVDDVGARFAHRVAYHDSCHLLRELGVSEEPRRLLRAVRGAELVELGDNRLCCGFGGTFSVKFPEVSVAMGDDKIKAALEAGAEYLVANDSGCLMHLAGLIHRQGVPLKTMHLAEVLASR